MAAHLVTSSFWAAAVFSIADSMMWARNSQELKNKAALDIEFTPKLKPQAGFGFDRRMNDGEEEKDSEPLAKSFQEKLSIVRTPKFRIAVTNPNGNAVSTINISPHLVVAYTDLVKRMSVGIILKRRTVLTTCVSTLVQIEGQLFSIKAEYFVILSEFEAHGEVTVQPINLVAEIRRHPFCGMPFGRGPWMNDMAILILHAELIPRLMPLELASENFFNIFSLIQERISTGAICQAIGIEFRNTTSAFLGTSIDVRIVDKSKCGRLCSYMIPQCEPQIGGYFVQFANLKDKSRIEEWLAEAALVCDGKLYGVVNVFNFPCDASLVGLAPKPEAVLHMHLSTAKLLAGPTSKPPHKRDTAAALISTSWAVWVAVTAIWGFPQ